METKRNGWNRVAVTGLGVVSPLGHLAEFWPGLLEGKSGIRRTTQFDPQDLGVKISAEVDFEPGEYIDRKTARRMARASQMALIAARMALEDAGLVLEAVSARGERVGVSVGTVIAGVHIPRSKTIPNRLDQRSAKHARILRQP
jgi:3-oxoacyl-[acyl-carrier-protein] synthase II